MVISVSFLKHEKDSAIFFQVLVSSLVIYNLDYCNSLLAGLPMNTVLPLDMIQNACFRYKTVMLAYKSKNVPACLYLNVFITPRSAPCSLRTPSTTRLVPPFLGYKVSMHQDLSMFWHQGFGMNFLQMSEKLSHWVSPSNQAEVPAKYTELSQTARATPSAEQKRRATSSAWQKAWKSTEASQTGQVMPSDQLGRGML